MCRMLLNKLSSPRIQSENKGDDCDVGTSRSEALVTRTRSFGHHLFDDVTHQTEDYLDPKFLIRSLSFIRVQGLKKPHNTVA
eukprot:scaffold16052_cov72-Cylindrotheca_fusiformis.AAC.1